VKIVITGPPGVGKTTLVKKLVDQLGDRAVGFWTEEVRDPRSGKRTGFVAVTTDGRRILFASKTFTSKYLVGSYGVNLQRFESAVLPVLREALEAGRNRVVIVDEVGKMELFSKQFRDLVGRIVRDPGLNVVVTIPLRDVHPLVREIRRLPSAVLIELTRTNREGMAEEILSLLSGDL